MEMREVDASLADGDTESAPFLDREFSPNLEDKDKILTTKRYQSVRYRFLRLSQYLHHASFFIPSFWSGKTSTKELHETAYLDGLRGYACYAVFFAHHLIGFCNEMWHPYGEGGNLHFVQTSYFFQLPIIRLMYNGQAAITVFFVMSGYVLSYKPLKLIHAHDHEKLQAALTSSIFRRWLRLFLPVAALWIINLLLVEFGAFTWFTQYRIDNPKMPPGMVETYISAGTSFWDTTHKAFTTYLEYCRYTLFQWTGSGFLPEVDGHTWTLHVEFRSSCLLFLFLHGTSRMQPNLRLGFFMLSTIFCLYWDQWAIATFLAGSAIADLDLRMRRLQRLSSTQIPSSPTTSTPRFTYSHLRAWLLASYAQILYTLLVFFALMLLSFPSMGAGNIFFYDVLAAIAPSPVWDMFFYQSIGAMILVFTAGRLQFLQSFLSLRFSQYIGKTSFALYLVHGTVIKTLGYFTVIKSWELITGYEGWGYAMGILLPFVLVVAPVTVVASDWFWRGVDIPSVRFARWLERVVGDKAI